MRQNLPQMRNIFTAYPMVVAGATDTFFEAKAEGKGPETMLCYNESLFLVTFITSIFFKRKRPCTLKYFCFALTSRGGS